MKFVFIFLFAGMMFSCRPKTGWLLNGQKKISFINECGKIEISAYSVRSYHFITYRVKEGSFVFNVDSINLILNPEAENFFIAKKFNQKDITGKVIANKKDELVYIFKWNNEDYNSMRFRKMIVLPSDNIMCNYKPLVKDTIEIMKPIQGK